MGVRKRRRRRRRQQGNRKGSNRGRIVNVLVIRELPTGWSPRGYSRPQEGTE